MPHCRSTTTTSVVIPTYKRHEEVIRAIRSALAQTLPPLEVLVVNDGPDPEKGRRIAKIGDDRVRFHVAPRCRNASATRNYGIHEAKGEWVALLDDDDVWRPDKLKNQFGLLKQSGLTEAILGCVEEVHLPSGSTYCRPKAGFDGPVAGDVLLFAGMGGLHTSTLVAPRRSFQCYPFNERAERHEDWEWLLQANQEWPIIVSLEIGCDRWLRPGEGLSRPGGFEFSKAWYEQNRALLGPMPRAEFVARILSRKAAHDRNLRALPWLWRELNATGKRSPARLARLVTPWLIPSKARLALKGLRNRIARP